MISTLKRGLFNQARNTIAAVHPRRISDVGIVNAEIYFPSTSEEKAEAPKRGLNDLDQRRVGFCLDNEDVKSTAMSAVSSLLEKSNVPFSDVGFLDVSTETLAHFDGKGMHAISTTYGGTTAVINALNWAKAREGNDKPYAVVVCSDIVAYSDGNEEPKRDTAAVALLIGREPAIAIDRDVVSAHSSLVYDCYKPPLASSYPVIDGKLSTFCYFKALDLSYQDYCSRMKKEFNEEIDTDSFDGLFFHAPYNTLGEKAFTRMKIVDFVRSSIEKRKLKFAGLERFNDIVLDESYDNKDLFQSFTEHSLSEFSAKTRPSFTLAENLGNMYTTSLYNSLVSYVALTPFEKLLGQRVGFFSYNADYSAAFFGMKFTENEERLKLMHRSQEDVLWKLFSRTEETSIKLEEQLGNREETKMFPFELSHHADFPERYLASINEYKQFSQPEETPGMLEEELGDREETKMFPFKLSHHANFRERYLASVNEYKQFSQTEETPVRLEDQLGNREETNMLPFELFQHANFQERYLASINEYKQFLHSEETNTHQVGRAT